MKILELTLAAIDLPALRRFYGGILGLREVSTTPRAGDRLAVQAGSTRLIFVPAPAGAAHPRYHFAFNIPPARYAAAVDWLRQRGGLIASPTGEDQFQSSSWRADMVYFSDPQGNILELIARYTLPEADQGKGAEHTGSFNAPEILCVSEIGVAADSVADASGLLRTRIPGLENYIGEGSEDFTAVGDAHGLFIVVRRGRIWYPETGVPAAFNPLNVLVQMEGSQMYRLTAPPFPFDIRAENLPARL